jgi:predicted secreted protein
MPAGASGQPTRKVVTRFIEIARRLTGRLRGQQRRDAPAGRIVAVIECVLNQNARDEGAAISPALNGDVLRLCSEHAIGIVQIPCPEMRVLGPARTRPPGTSIRAALDTDAGRRCCREISVETADRLQEYARNGYTVLAVLGGNAQSPGCAVHNGRSGLLPASGVLMRALQPELRQRGLELPFLAMRDADPAALATDVDRLAALVNSVPAATGERRQSPSRTPADPRS